MRWILIAGMVMMSGCETTTRKPVAQGVSGLPDSPAREAELPNGLPADAPTLLAKAKSAQRLGKNDEALYYFVKALELEPNQPEALLAIGGIHRQRGNLDLAEVAYRLMLKTAPRNVEALEGLGLCLLEKHSDQEAGRFLSAVVAADKNRWQTYNGLGLLADRAGNPGEAVRQYEQALRLNPREPQVLTNLGYAKYESGDFSGALVAYDNALRLDPQYESAWLNKGLLLAKQGQENAAIEAFRHVLSEADAYNDLGYIYMMQNNIDAAYLMFEKAIAVSPSYHARANENLQKLKHLQ